MPDRSKFWSPVPDWSRAAIQHHGLSVTVYPTAAVWLVSGNLSRFLENRGGLPCLGPKEFCATNAYALRQAPDRLLFVGQGVADERPTFGWSEDGTAITDVSDGFLSFDIKGSAALDLMKLGADYAFEAKTTAPAESASLLFAGLKVVVARLPDGWRLHVERPYATALWQWLQQAASAWAKPPAVA